MSQDDVVSEDIAGVDFDYASVPQAEAQPPAVRALPVSIALSLTLVFFSEDVTNNPMKLFSIKDWRAAISRSALSASVLVYPVDASIDLSDKSLQGQVISQALIGSLSSVYSEVDSSVAGQIDLCAYTDAHSGDLNVSVGACYEMPVPKTPDALRSVAESARRRASAVAHSELSVHAILIPYSEVFSLDRSDLSLSETLSAMSGVESGLSLIAVDRTPDSGIVTPIYVSADYEDEFNDESVTESEKAQCLAMLDKLIANNESLSKKRDFAIAVFFV